MSWQNGQVVMNPNLSLRDRLQQKLNMFDLKRGGKKRYDAYKKNMRAHDDKEKMKLLRKESVDELLSRNFPGQDISGIKTRFMDGFNQGQITTLADVERFLESEKKNMSP